MSRAFVLAVFAFSSVSLAPVAWSAPLPTRFRVVPQVGHGAEIGAAALSSDGKLVATSSKDGSLKIWNARTGLLLRTIAVSESDFPAVAFVDDTQVVVAAPLLRRRGEPPLSLWNAVEGTRVRGIGETRDVPRALSVSSDGRRAATLHADGDVVVWDVDRALRGEGAASVRAIDAGADAVLALSGSGRHLATAATAVRIWGAESGALEKTLPAGLSRPSAIALSDDGAAVAIADSAAIVSWDVAAAKQRCRIDVTADEVALSPDARAAAVLDRAGMLRVWDLTKCVAHPAFTVGKKSRPRVALGPLGARVFVSAEDGARFHGRDAHSLEVVEGPRLRGARAARLERRRSGRHGEPRRGDLVERGDRRQARIGRRLDWLPRGRVRLAQRCGRPR
jgi:WD40 repeat protein